MQTKYRIMVHYYKSKYDVELGKPYKVCESGFENLTLREAYICKSKMSDENFCGMIRINVIEEQA